MCQAHFTSEVSPIRPDDHLRYCSRPADGIRTRLQPRELSVHVVVHQGVALVGFLQHGINRNAPGDVLQFHDGHAHHERDIPHAKLNGHFLSVQVSGINAAFPPSFREEKNAGENAQILCACV